MIKKDSIVVGDTVLVKEFGKLNTHIVERDPWNISALILKHNGGYYSLDDFTNDLVCYSKGGIELGRIMMIYDKNDKLKWCREMKKEYLQEDYKLAILESAELSGELVWHTVVKQANNLIAFKDAEDRYFIADGFEDDFIYYDENGVILATIMAVTDSENHVIWLRF